MSEELASNVAAFHAFVEANDVPVLERSIS